MKGTQTKKSQKKMNSHLMLFSNFELEYFSYMD